MTIENDFYIKNKDTDFYNFFEVKTEKIVTAVYMITNFLSDREPIKWKLREVCLAMLSKATVLKEKNVQERSDMMLNILNIISEIISLLEIAHLSGFISEMNYSVLKREFISLKKQIETRGELKNSLGGISFSETFFDTDKSLPSISSLEKETPRFDSVGGIPQKNLSSDISDGNKQNEAKSKMSFIKPKDKVLSVGGEDKDKSYASVESNIAKDKRSEIISQILKDKKELTIKDISLKITDCSEKTIQRELVSMLQKGLLKKTGERRWSRYSLA